MKQKLKALHAVARGESIARAAAAAGIGQNTLRRALAKTKNFHPRQWGAILADNRPRNSGRRAAHAGDYKNFYARLQADYLRAEQPTLQSCYDRAILFCAANGFASPPLHAARRHIAKLPPAAVVAARGGGEKLDALYPAQQRHTQNLYPLDAINADGWPLDVFVQPPPAPNGAPRGVVRPCLWAAQDVATRKILSWRLAENESADLILATIADIVAAYGVPQCLHLDNTRAASAAWLSGNRRRGNVNVAGVLDECGITLQRTELVDTFGKTASGARRNRGRGQSKPVERAFRDFADRIAKHPALAGYYTGNKPDAKPFNYNAGASGAPWQLVESIVAQEVAAYNARENRRAAPLAATGESSDALFERLLIERPPRPACADNMLALLAPAETTKIKRDGTFSLRAGAAAGFGANRYHHEDLLRYANKTLLARYDPSRLHGEILLTDGKGKIVCLARCLVAAGFSDTAAAAEHNRNRRRWVAANRAAARAAAALPAGAANAYAPPPAAPQTAPRAIADPLRQKIAEAQAKREREAAAANNAMDDIAAALQHYQTDEQSNASRH